ncbi:MAG: lysine--tRNA ligase [Alphaproteobacteria bacterium]
MTDLRDIAMDSNAWPFVEARKILKRIEQSGVPEKGYILFETGYGPSGLPHIGTFCEVARTTMVRHALSTLSDVPTKLIAFSDDMDGLRKVPDNIPEQEMMAGHLNKALTSVPDPFGTHPSFGEHNNARLCAFLDQYGFDYEFKSSTATYQAGEFDETLLRVLDRYDAIMNVVLPTLGEERRKTYSPFFPVDPETREVLQVPTVERNVAAGTIVYEKPDGTKRETSVTGGACKLQWKCDWGMRWAALDVDYEMSGKDLTDSVKLGSRITQILGQKPPEGLIYEMFLDQKGEKISKSKGNGISIDEWLRYATEESLALYVHQSPRKAKRLYFDVIPKAVDEYITFSEKFAGEAPEKQLQNPVWHIHGGNPPKVDVPVSFGLLLNLVSAANTEDEDTLWGFINRYADGVSPQTHPMLAAMVTNAIAYFDDFVKPTKSFRAPSADEAKAMTDLRDRLLALDPDLHDGKALQDMVFAVGKEHGFENLRDWFKALYETLLGQSQGPRMGGFIAIYGVENTAGLIDKALAGELAA